MSYVMYHPSQYNTPTLEATIEKHKYDEEWTEWKLQAKVEIAERKNGKPFPPERDEHDKRDDHLNTNWSANMADKYEQEREFLNEKTIL